MDAKKRALLIEWMERLDRGARAPAIGGEVGSFLRRYVRERNDIVQLAISRNIDIRADGALSGTQLGTITLLPLFPRETAALSDTHWGSVARFVCLSPELSSCVVLRVWLATDSGSEIFRLLTNAPTSVVQMEGDFRWLPPSVITPGTATFELRGPTSNETWMQVPYLKATADDLNDIPHVLDYIDINRNGDVQLVCLRTVAVVRLSGDEFIVPGGWRMQSLTISSSLSREISRHLDGRFGICLLYREPHQSGWKVWRVHECPPIDLLKHSIGWSCYMRYISGKPTFDDEIVAQSVQTLDACGVQLEDLDERSLSYPSFAAKEFAREIAARLRLS